MAARAGARVTILYRGPRPLEGFDPDLVGLLVMRTREVGIRVESRPMSTGSTNATAGSR